MRATQRPTLPGPFRAVVLDMDGLLVDTEPIWLDAKRRMFARYGTPFDHADHLAVLGRDDDFTASYFAQRFGLPPGSSEPIRVAYLDLVRTLFADGIPIRPGALDLIGRLRGLVPLALASNTKRDLVDAVLARVGIADAFDAVATSSDAAPKPAPDIYALACRLLGVEPAAAVALEDSPAGITAARAAGLTCIAVPSESGTDVSHADLIVGSLLDLL